MNFSVGHDCAAPAGANQQLQTPRAPPPPPAPGTRTASSPGSPGTAAPAYRGCDTRGKCGPSDSTNPAVPSASSIRARRSRHARSGRERISRQHQTEHAREHRIDAAMRIPRRGERREHVQRPRRRQILEALRGKKLDLLPAARQSLLLPRLPVRRDERQQDQRTRSAAAPTSSTAAATNHAATRADPSAKATTRPARCHCCDRCGRREHQPVA